MSTRTEPASGESEWAADFRTFRTIRNSGENARIQAAQNRGQYGHTKGNGLMIVGGVSSRALLAAFRREHKVALAIQEVGAVLAPPSRGSGVFEGKDIDGVEAIHRIARVQVDPPEQDAEDPLPPGLGPGYDAGRQPRTTAAQGPAGQW